MTTPTTTPLEAVTAELAQLTAREQALTAEARRLTTERDDLKARRAALVADGGAATAVAAVNRRLVALGEELDGITEGKAVIAQRLAALRNDRLRAEAAATTHAALAQLAAADAAVRRWAAELRPLVAALDDVGRRAIPAYVDAAHANGRESGGLAEEAKAATRAAERERLTQAVAALLAYVADVPPIEADVADLDVPPVVAASSEAW